MSRHTPPTIIPMDRHLSWILVFAAFPVHAADERGMASQLGAKSWASCARFMSQPNVRVYELSQLRSNTMPLSPFAGPYQLKPKPTSALPGTVHAFNSEQMNDAAAPGQQGTQIDALGHFAVLKQPLHGKPPAPTDSAVYYGGLTQQEVKPTPDSPLLKLGIEKIPPLVTSAGLLVTAKHIEEMLKVQGLSRRGIRAGDVVYVHTGWGDYWRDPDVEKSYYSKAPGLSYDAARYLGERRIVAIGLDTPFIDAVPEGMLAGKGAPAAGTPPGMHP